ncbi:MAG: DUF3300 domain-containing protein [Planctomycetes bacterium]|nr:DUF3300 domain-containing protein [Planctomycetota bacterium]
MTTYFIRDFRPRWLLMAALALTVSTNLHAQDSEQLQVARAEVDPGNRSTAAGAGQSATPLSPQQLDELLGPIALYPDPLLAQVLAAATYPMDIVQAVRLLNSSTDLSQLDQMGLDPSVQALARFPDTLKMMDAELDWTNALGAAFLNQQQDVMDAVQRLRTQAISNGALQSSPQQEVYTEEAFVGILPADPQIIYVPQYVPEVVYGWVEPPIGGYFSSISFGVGYSTGSWLNLGFNWGGRCLSYRPWPLWHGGYYRGGYLGGRGFCGVYYGHGGWGGAWHRRFGSSLPRFRGGASAFRGGRGFSSLRGGFANRSAGGFANRQGGSREGIGNSRRGGEGFGNGPRAGLGRGGTSTGFGNGTRAGERNDGLASPRSSGADRGGLAGDTKNSTRNNPGNAEFGGGLRNRAASDNKNNLGNGPSGRPGGSSQNALGNETGKRDPFSGFGRSPRDGRPSDSRGAGRSSGGDNRGDLLNRDRADRDGGRSGLHSGVRPNQEGRNSDNSFGGSRSSGARGTPRAFDSSSTGGGRDFFRGSPQRGYSGGDSPSRSFGSSGSRDAGRMPGFSGGGRSSGGSAFRGGGSSSSSPRMESRSGGMSMRSPAGSSSGGMRSSGNRSGDSAGRGGGRRGR